MTIPTKKAAIQFQMKTEDRRRLKSLPWHAPLEEWVTEGVQLLLIRRGESRHPVVFVEIEGFRYAIKETTPRMAEREIRNLEEIERRGIPTLTAVGSVLVPVAPIAVETSINGVRQYISGDRGYTVTRLAPRVVPHALLYRIPFNKRTKHRLLSAVAVLMVELHEHGIYWGDPSLANVLIRIDGRSILGIMADAETTELFPGPVSDGLREQDLASFGESLAWQAEDLRQARGLPEEAQVIDDSDYRYFLRRYHWLRREHARAIGKGSLENNTAVQLQDLLRNLNRWSYSLLDGTGHAFQQLTTVLPGWYQRRIYEFLHIHVPRVYAHRFYNMILGHQTMMSRSEQRDVSIEEAAHDWYTRYHLPTVLLLRRSLTSEQDPMQAYFAVMQHKWDMSKRAGYEVPLEEAILDWSMQSAETGTIGAVDPAQQASWWRERKPVAQVLEPPLIESADLEPLLSTNERPLVRLDPPALEEKLPEILQKSQQAEDE